MVILAVREGNVPWDVVMRMPLPNLVALCKQITKSVYRENYEYVWANFVASQCSKKNLEDFTKPWKGIAGIR